MVALKTISIFKSNHHVQTMQEIASHSDSYLRLEMPHILTNNMFCPLINVVSISCQAWLRSC